MRVCLFRHSRQKRAQGYPSALDAPQTGAGDGGLRARRGCAYGAPDTHRRNPTHSSGLRPTVGGTEPDDRHGAET